MRLLIAYMLLAYAAPVLSDGVHHIPLMLRQNHTALEQLLQSQHYETVNVGGEESQLPAVPMVLVNMYFYNLGSLTVGDPEKKIDVDFNIYFSDTSLVDKAANPLYSYNSSESRSFKKSSKRFETGEPAEDGYWATDYFKVPSTELEVHGQPFGWIYHLPSALATSTMSMLSLGPVKDANSFLDRIKNQLKDPLYSIYFEPVDHQPTLQRLSLTFGDVDNHCSKESLFFTDYVNVSIIEERFRPWAFHVRAILIHQTIWEYGTSLHLDEDAGLWMYPVILGPAQHVTRLAEFLGAVRAGPLSFYEYEIDCKKRATAPYMSFIVGNNFIELKPSDYIIKVTIEGTSISSCYLAFASNVYGISAGDKWMIGTPLFNSKCLVVDFGRNKIGFSLAKNA